MRTVAKDPSAMVAAVAVDAAAFGPNTAAEAVAAAGVVAAGLAGMLTGAEYAEVVAVPVVKGATAATVVVAVVVIAGHCAVWKGCGTSS